MNTELRKLAKNDFEKDLFKLMNNSVFGKTMENIRKHRDIKLVTTDKKRSKLVSEPNYHTIKLISEDLSIIEMKKTKVRMNKPIYLGLSVLEISKILMYEFWYDYMKPKYNDNVRLCYMDTDSFVMHIKTNDFYKDIASDVENRFDTSNYEVNRPLPTGKNKKVIGLMKDELGGKIITEFVTLRPKTYSFLTGDGKEDKKAKGTKKCIIKKMIKFNDYKKCLLNGEIILKSQQRFISNKHDVYTENINKIALSNSDDKRILLSNKITSYPYGYVLNLNDPHAFIEYSSDMNDVLEDIKNYNKKRDKKVLIIFDDMIADIMRSEKFKAIVKELFIRCRKLNISIVFITESYFRTPKDTRLNSTHYILMKMGNKKELKSIAEENSGHLDFKDFLKIYNHCTNKPYSFMMVDARPTARVTFKKTLMNQ